MSIIIGIIVALAMNSFAHNSKQEETATQETLSEIVVLLDCSGSMSSTASDAIGGFNAFVEEQKKVPGEAVLTLVQFNSQDPHEVVYDRMPLEDVPKLTVDTYQPRASTPLYDALGWTLDYIGQALDVLAEENKPGVVIFAILTDGLENDSKEYTKDGVFKLVDYQQEKHDWKFAYLGANQDAMAVAAGIGIRYDANALNVSGFVGIGTGAASMNVSVTSYRTGKGVEPDSLEAE